MNLQSDEIAPNLFIYLLHLILKYIANECIGNTYQRVELVPASEAAYRLQLPMTSQQRVDFHVSLFHSR